MSVSALGVWGAVQSLLPPAAQSRRAGSCATRSHTSARPALGPALRGEAAGYVFVYHIEILLLFLALAALGPLVRLRRVAQRGRARPSGLLELRRQDAKGGRHGHYCRINRSAQVVLYAFWIFFAGLILYLRREDKREGYPLESDRGRPRGRAGLSCAAHSKGLPHVQRSDALSSRS